MATKKAFHSLSTLPIRPFKYRLSAYRSTNPLAVLLYNDPVDPIFFSKSDSVTKINKQILSLIDRAKRYAIVKGLAGVCLKNYGLKENCFVMLKNDFLIPGQWQNYAENSLNLGSYETFLNAEFIQESAVGISYLDQHDRMGVRRLVPQPQVRFLETDLWDYQVLQRHGRHGH